MYSIRVEGDIQPLLKKLQHFSDLDKKGLNTALAEVVVESTDQHFKQGKDPQGKRWKTSIRAATEGGKTLIKSTQLRTGIHSEADATGWAVGTNVKHAATHQYGATRTIRAKTQRGLRFQIGGRWVTKKQVKVTIPARPFLGLSDDDWAELKATIEDFVGEEN